MTTKLAQCLNKTILVSIPALFGDEQPRPFTLIGIEPCGLWLESEPLAERLQSADKTQPSLRSLTAFFPFSQIFYVVDPVQFAMLARSPAARLAPREESPSPPQKTDRVERRSGKTARQP